MIPCYDLSPSRDAALTVPALSRSSAFPTGDESKTDHHHGPRTGGSGATSRSLNPHKRVFSTSTVEFSQSPQLKPASRTLPSHTNRTQAANTYIAPPPEQLPRHGHTSPVLDSHAIPNKSLSSVYDEGTPRSSVDFYTASNNSSDTLASEYVNQDHERFPQQSIGTRPQPLLPSSKPRQIAETLMMGYGSIVGFFHLDASLMNPNAFDEVKKKGVVGNQGGGGVVRAESSKPRGGLLGSLDRGETLGYDLMSPRVILHEQPSIAVLDGSSDISAIRKKPNPQTKVILPDEDFRSYISNLLSISGADSGFGPLSPSAAEVNDSGAALAELATVEDNIAIAIQQSNSVKPSKISTTRFEVARSGSRIAVILLVRPSYRLGEVIPITVDFHKSDIRCYSLHTTLETVEQIDPAIAQRSQATVSRVTRKILASQHHSTTSATRVVFNLAIPGSSTPEFITSGVRLNWSLRFELVTGNALGDTALEDPQALLEEVVEDERGSVLAAIQAVTCETFDVTLPIQVFGAISKCDDSNRFQEDTI
ncbi:MAG: hypothetical protein Q9183_000392 [Haloplaca sp. 2 TL-2023]